MCVPAGQAAGSTTWGQGPVQVGLVGEETPFPGAHLTWTECLLCQSPFAQDWDISVSL